MKSAELPKDLEALTDCLESMRSDAFGDGREDKNWMEWWCVVEVYKRLRRLRGRTLNWAIEHTEQHEGSPDFFVVEDTVKIAVEITEATVPEDRRAIRAARGSGETRGLGDPIEIDGKSVPGGRFRGGTCGDAWETALSDDICNAIKRKSKKGYASGARLVVYPNSNATFADPARAFEIFRERVPQNPFSRIDVLWVGGGLVQIENGDVRHYSKGQVTDED